jgi:hypothetical protein
VRRLQELHGIHNIFLVAGLEEARTANARANLSSLSDDLIFSYYVEGLYGGLYERLS